MVDSITDTTSFCHFYNTSRTV